MEQKTIGSFIAILRKANGMTQRELAEKLNVSDKAVSRWERDECAPDLTLIPVLAEIFGVTSDELLRGERATNKQSEETQTVKTEKQLDRLLEANATRLKIRSIISGGIAVVGLLAAMICNSALLRSSLGFFVGCIFYLAAVIAEACFAVAAFSAVNGDEFDEEKLYAHKAKLRKIIIYAAAVIVVMFIVTLPLLLGDVYVGIDGGDWLLYALLYLAVLATALIFISWIFRVVLTKKGRIKASETTIKKDKLKIKISVITAAVLALTALGHAAVYSSIPASAFVEGTVHNSISNFKSFIETPVPYSGYNYNIYEEAQTQIMFEEIPEDEYYTDYVQEWEDILEQNEEIVYSTEGTELFRYSHLNENIAEIHFADSEDKLPITTYTHDQLRQGNGFKKLFIHCPFILLYLAEAMAGIIIYRKKSK